MVVQRLCARGLAPDVREEEVRARFASFGNVRGVEVVRDTALGGTPCRGFAFVAM